MKYLLPFSILGAMLLAMPAGCSPTMEQQVGTFAHDFVLQALAAYLF